jgi:hypothetical protein
MQGLFCRCSLLAARFSRSLLASRGTLFLARSEQREARAKGE